jgi:ATP adenylyltransferase
MWMHRNKDGECLDHIWTPWRMKYIMKNNKNPDCIFCSAAASEADEENLIFYRGEHVFMILNRYPYTSGHVMCVPYDHVPNLQDLTLETRVELMEYTTKAVTVLQNVYSPGGFNIGMNLGRVAGAGVAAHLHMHVVPRWEGDTSFMSSVGNARVLPESLPDTYQRVMEAWESFM